MFCIYHKETTRFLTDTKYETIRGAKTARTKICKKEGIDPQAFDVCEVGDFRENIELKKRVQNLMSGKWLTIPVNTPVHLDPSCETYWQM